MDQRPATYRGGTAHRPIRTAPEVKPDPREQTRRPQQRPAREVRAPARADTLNLRDVLVAMLDRVEAVVAFAVVAADGPPTTAYAAAVIARAEMMEAAHDLALSMGAENGFDGPLGRVEASKFPPDWPALADRFGFTVDESAWREAEGILPYWQDVEPPEAPYPWNAQPKT